ncbi:hypothetical protein HAX54_041068, partial [Datura stramonium]|nr:hypothetical protein [Datura stramonium]
GRVTLREKGYWECCRGGMKKMRKNRVLGLKEDFAVVNSAACDRLRRENTLNVSQR